MPCYTIKKTSVNVSTMDLTILLDALKGAGFDARLDQRTIIFSKQNTNLYHTYHNGVLTIAGRNVEDLTGEVKRAYALGVVRSTMQKHGWKTDQKTVNNFVATKRSY